MKIETTPLQDCFIVHDTVFPDARGYFFESFNKKRFSDLTGIETEFVQDNQSSSTKGVLRGLHFQTGQHAQAKLVRVLQGAVYDVAVDMRRTSSTFGKWFGIELNAENHKQLYIPKGLAHGFLVLSETCTFFYKCDNYYNKASEIGIMYNDKDLNIQWPLNDNESALLSEKDLNNLSFKEVSALI